MSGVGYSIYENAVLVPPKQLDGRQYDGKAGVFDAHGNFIAAAITRSSGRNRHAAPEFPTGAEFPCLAGTHAFGGVFFGHFGHFITESTGRLWVLNQPKLDFESFVYLPKDRLLPRWQFAEKERLLAALGINARLATVAQPTRVERLIVPDAEFGLDDSLIDGSPRYVDFMRKAAASRVAAKGGEKLYISRRSLLVDRGTILGEALVEDWLAHEGYTIFEPQKFSPEDQIAQYRAARKIISVDASPLHLYAYAADAGQQVAIIRRRSMNAYRNIIRHIRAFSGASVAVIDALKADYVPAHTNRAGRSSWGLVDFPAIGNELARLGMIRPPGDWPAAAWQALHPQQIEAQMTGIARQAGADYRHLPAQAA